MNKLIYRGIQFLAILLGLVGVNYGLNTLAANQDVPLDCQTLLMGDSHVMSALNPEALVQAQNIAQTAESYFVSFVKLRKILKSNPQIEQVILGFSPHNLSAFNDQKLKLWPWRDHQFNKIYSLVSRRDLREVPYSKLAYYKALLKNKGLRFMPDAFPYLGQYLAKPSRLHRASLGNSIQRHYFEQELEWSISKLSKRYLAAILDLCNRHQIQLILIATPLHPRYRESIPPSFTQAYKACRKELAKKNITILDYSDLGLADSAFYDYDHVSEEGAHVVSVLLASFLQTKRQTLDL